MMESAYVRRRLINDVICSARKVSQSDPDLASAIAKLDAWDKGEIIDLPIARVDNTAISSKPKHPRLYRLLARMNDPFQALPLGR